MITLTVQWMCLCATQGDFGPEDLPFPCARSLSLTVWESSQDQVPIETNQW